MIQMENKIPINQTKKKNFLKKIKKKVRHWQKNKKELKKNFYKKLKKKVMIQAMIFLLKKINH